MPGTYDSFRVRCSVAEQVVARCHGHAHVDRWLHAVMGLHSGHTDVGGDAHTDRWLHAVMKFC